MNELSFYACRDLPGIGGAIKQEPQDFIVEEVPAYQPVGSGEHVYLRVRRQGRNTRELQMQLARCLGLSPANVGLAGQKDKHALTTQYFSVHLHQGEAAQIAERVQQELGVEVLDARRHLNKLRLGHLAGNRFQIRVRGVLPQALERAQALAQRLEQQGLANAFGEQRFGREGDNALRGKDWFTRKPKGWLANLQLSAWQSELFHQWLELRQAQAALPQLVLGDIAERVDGPQFLVDELPSAQARQVAGELVPTGPLWGSRMRTAQHQALEWEQAVLHNSGVSLEDLARVGLPGARRAAWIRPQHWSLHEDGADLWIGFQLPPGSYATVVLREFTKQPS